LTFLFDATFPAKLGRALAVLSRDHSFIHVDDHLGQGATDEAVIAAASASGSFLVTLDQGITRNPAKREALLQGGVGTFVFTGSAIGTLGYYKIVAFVMSIAEEMFDSAQRTKRPFIYGISDRKKFDKLA
jgi:hypothetical protein